MEPWFDGTLLRQTLRDGGFASVQKATVTEGMWGAGTKDFESVLVEKPPGYGGARPDRRGEG